MSAHLQNAEPEESIPGENTPPVIVSTDPGEIQAAVLASVQGIRDNQAMDREAKVRALAALVPACPPKFLPLDLLLDLVNAIQELEDEEMDFSASIPQPDGHAGAPDTAPPATAPVAPFIPLEG